MEEENIKVIIGSQSDRRFLKTVLTEIPPIDILIDDGGHTMLQQLITFEELFYNLKSEGIYLCEDIHTSYLTAFGGGLKRKGSFIEFSKTLIDKLNAFHYKSNAHVSEFTKSVKSLHYYDSMLVVEKGIRGRPTTKWTGKIQILDYKSDLKFTDQFEVKIKNKIKRLANKILSIFKLPFKNGDF